MMSGDAKELAFIHDQVQLCMLPSLKTDLDEVQIQRAHFHSYHSILKEELPKLYDLLQRNEDVLLNDAVHQHSELRAQLVVLFCELTASPTIYNLDNDYYHLVQNANRFLAKLNSVIKNPEEMYIFSFYEQKLQKDSWKRQLGPIHGYVRYLQQRYVNDVKMSKQMLTFSVAVGLNVRESFQAEYKQLGVRIFTHMLKHGRPEDFQQMNIHGVIYEHVLKDVHSMDTIDATIANWNCLCLCLDHFTELNSLTWNQCDDMLERLVQHVSLSSSTQMAVELINIITKLGYHFAINKAEISVALDCDWMQPNKVIECFEACASLNVCTSYRWVKSILEMMVLVSEKLLGSASAAVQMLVGMQRCFLVCVLPIPLQAMGTHLREFYAKFVAVLLESLSVHKNNQEIQTLTHQFIQIFIYQLKNGSPDHQVPCNLKPYLNALEKLPQVIAK